MEPEPERDRRASCAMELVQCPTRTVLRSEKPSSYFRTLPYAESFTEILAGVGALGVLILVVILAALRPSKAVRAQGEPPPQIGSENGKGIETTKQDINSLESDIEGAQQKGSAKNNTPAAP